MEASIVVPTYERPGPLEACVQSLRQQSVDDYEILIVDDGSTDPAQHSVLNRIEAANRVTVHRQENAGPAAARNRGWRAAEADTVFFTDDDCLVPSDWVERLGTAFEPNVGAVGGPLVPTEEARQRAIFARLHDYRNTSVYEQPDGPTIGGTDLPMGGTANIAYRREALEEVDGFDEDFPTAAGEDADLQSRVCEAGYRMKFIDVPVEHNDEYNPVRSLKRAFRHGRGDYYYQKKHGTPRSVPTVAAGALGAPLSGVRAFLSNRSVRLAAALTLATAATRLGELAATYDDRH